MKTFLFFRQALPFLTSAFKMQNATRPLITAPPKPLTTHIPFNQKVLCDEIRKYDYIYSKLHSIYKSYNGLCELICNYIIVKDVLSESSSNDCLNAVNVIGLNKPAIKNSHILENSSLLSFINAYLFSSYPYDLFSSAEVIKDNKIDEKLLASKLDKINQNNYIKFFVFSQTFFSFKGHSMLIKKMGSNYIFFDPNQGMDTYLSINELCEKLNFAYTQYKGTTLAFIDGTKYIASLHHEELKSETSSLKFSM